MRLDQSQMGWNFPGDDRGFSDQEQSRDAADQLIIMQLECEQQLHVTTDDVIDDIEEGTR